MSITLWQYYLNESKRFHDFALGGIAGLEEWKSEREIIYRQHLRSVGLDCMPEKNDLSTSWHGDLSGEGFVARKVSYQLLPDCYGTGIVFYPEPLPMARLPAVLYCCGHSPCGSFACSKQGIMWARRGYICFVFDTIQQSDNPGTHLGFGNKARYDWISMGYGGICGELWNSIRALDVLLSLPEVDVARVGATGISGGGSLSFRTALVDPRIAAVASCSGVTTAYYSLRNRNFLRHCDCMFVQNVHGRDTAEYAALMAPRPLLFCYGNDDAMYSEPEYFGMRDKIAPVYGWHGCPEKFKVHQYIGPHGYTEDSINQVNRWFDLHVAGEERPMLQPEASPFTEANSSVFNGTPPAPNRTWLLPELLSPRGTVALPREPGQWDAIRLDVVKRLRHEVFHRILEKPTEMSVETVGNWIGGSGRFLRHLAQIDGVDLVVDEKYRDGDEVLIGVTDVMDNSQGMLHRMSDFFNDRSVFIVEPRGAGTTSTRLTPLDCDRDNYLLQAGSIVGITPLQLIIQDTLAVIGFVRSQAAYKDRKLILYGAGDSAVACLYAGILDDSVDGVVAHGMPGSHRNGAYIPGILRVLDLEQACGLLAPRPVAFVDMGQARQNWAPRLYARLGIRDRLIVKCQSADAAVAAVAACLKSKIQFQQAVGLVRQPCDKKPVGTDSRRARVNS